MTKARISIKYSYLLGALLPIFFFAIAPLFLSGYYLQFLLKVFGFLTLAVSWNLFSGYTKYVSLGSAAFLGIGIYTMALFHGFYPPGIITLPFPVAIFLGGIFSFLFALAVGPVTLRLRGIYFVAFTFGLNELLKHLVLWWEANVSGTYGRFVIRIGFSNIYYSMLIVTVACVLLSLFLIRTKIGFALRAIGECEDAAVHLGLNSSLYKVLAFAISSFFMGLVGAIFALRLNYINPKGGFDFTYSLMPAIMAMLGGAGTSYGPLLGVTVLSVVTEYLLIQFKAYYLIILGLIMIILVLFTPRGLVGIVEDVKMKIRR